MTFSTSSEVSIVCLLTAILDNANCASACSSILIPLATSMWVTTSDNSAFANSCVDSFAFSLLKANCSNTMA